MNKNKKKVLCDFKELSDEGKEAFLGALSCQELSIFSAHGQISSDVDLICSFSCLDNYLRCLNGQKSLYIPKPASKGIRIEALLNDRDCLWCTGYGMYANSLIKIDKSSMNMEMFPMPYEATNLERLFAEILRVENCLYLIPENSKYICIFDIRDSKWEKIDIEDETVDGWYYSAAVNVGKNIFFLPYKAKNIIKIDCRNHAREIIPIKMSKEIILFNERYGFCGTGAALAIDNDIYFYSRIYNCFMKFDTEKQCVETIRRLEDEDFSLACVADGNIFWMFTMSGDNKIVKYDIRKDEIEYFCNIPRIEYNRVPFYRGTKIGNKIVFAPGLAEKAIVFDIVTSEMRVLEELNIESYDKRNENWIYGCIDGDGENIYLFETKVNKLIKCNIKKNSVEKKELYVSEKEWYVGQARKVIQMVLQDVVPPALDGKRIMNEY